MAHCCARLGWCSMSMVVSKVELGVSAPVAAKAARLAISRL
jgi:hypothetical protein